METMNSELNGQLVELVKNINENGLGALDFAKEQAPDVVEQMLTWGFISSIGFEVVCLFIAALSFYFASKAWKIKKTASYHSEDWWELASIFSYFIGGVGSVLFICGLFDVAKVIITPKLWLIERIASMVR